jgi:hypothetical protein
MTPTGNDGLVDDRARREENNRAGNFGPEDVFQWLDKNPDALLRYLLERAPRVVLDAWLAPSSSPPAQSTSPATAAAATEDGKSGKMQYSIRLKT